MTMRFFAAVLLIACVGGLGCRSTPTGQPLTQAQADRARAEITQVMRDSAKAWNDNDLDAFMASFHRSDDLRFVVPSGITMGWDDLKTRYARSIANSDLRFSDLSIDVIRPDTALVFALFHNDTKDGGYGYGATSLLMKKIDGQWVIVHDHSSGLPVKDGG